MEYMLYRGVRVPVLRRERKALGEPEHRPEVEIGIYQTGRKFRYRCPVCQKVEYNDQRMEPCCTGPDWTDIHDLTVMRLEPVGTDGVG